MTHTNPTTKQEETVSRLKWQNLLQTGRGFRGSYIKTTFNVLFQADFKGCCLFKNSFNYYPHPI